MNIRRIFATAGLVICMFLTGCASSSYTALMCTETYTTNGWETTYKKLDGTKNVHFSVPIDKNCLVSGTVTTETGSIFFEIKDSDGNTCFTSDTFTEDGTFETMIDKSGKYYIYLNADEHCGSVDFEWSIIGESES